ncbi:heat-labile enterotoxin subunit alpha [Rahnella aquatilis]|nr:enterotoxin A family protein [Rahnella aquatilis]RBQ35581.1 heat-labile enterotoxin subunit alpha [Rahnella aquatilis]
MPRVILLLLFIFSVSAYGAPPSILYRSVMESPDVVKQTGGFLPRGMDGTRPNQPPPDISLFNHVNGAETGLARHDAGYVSTTESLTVAHSWVNNNLAGVGYIYYIQPTGNFIDVNGTLRQFSPYSGEMEYASLGMIRWQQIRGWREVSFGVQQEYVPNRDYNPSLYALSHAGGIEPQLAGFPPDHVGWSLEPWRGFGGCVLESSLKRSVLTENSNCIPVKTAQEAGSEYYYQYWGKFVVRVLFILDLQSHSDEDTREPHDEL